MAKHPWLSAVLGSFGLDIYILPLGDKSIDDDEFGIFLRHSQRAVSSFLRISICAGMQPPEKEDGIMRKPEQNDGITLSALLICLDGAGSKEGRIVIMTTNHPDHTGPRAYATG